MASMDIFKSDAFSMIEMTKFVNKVGYVPQFLDGIPGLVEPAPVRTTKVVIEQLASEPALIQTTPRGAPPEEQAKNFRDVRDFPTVRLARRDRIYASEIQDIRAAGSLTEFQTVQMEIAKRTAYMRRDLALTREYYKLGLVQGIVKDKDGATIRNWMTEFSQNQPAEIAFNLTTVTDDGFIFNTCNSIVRTIGRNLKGLGGPNREIYGLCGDQFYDQLRASAEIVNTFKNQPEASRLRDQFGRAWSVIDYGGIYFINYRGTDDTSTVAIPTDKVKFFPAGAGIFQWAMSPGEAFRFANSPGLEMYSWINTDQSGNDEWIEIQLRSYVLPICVQPSALMSGRAGA
jgi:hypothetical protein